VPPAVSGWTEMASKTVHYLLYAMLAAETVLGSVLRDRILSRMLPTVRER
jgi:cytochrome b561